MIAFGSRTTSARSFTYTAIYSHSLFDYLIHILGSTLHGERPIFFRSSESFSFYLAPLDLRPYNTLYISNLFLCVSPKNPAVT